MINIKAFRSMDGKLLRDNFIDISNENITLSYGNNSSYININNNNWNGFKNPSRELNKYYRITDKIQDINKTLKQNIDNVFKIRKDRLVQNKADIDNLETNLIPIRKTNNELRVRYKNKYGSIEGFVDYNDLDYDDDLNYYQKVFYSLIKSLFDIIGGKYYFVIEGFRQRAQKHLMYHNK
jgi:hypothetical protein